MWLAHVVDATPRRGWGGGVGDVNVPCDLLTLLVLRHAGVGVGVGGDVNVPWDLLSLLMLRHAGVGGGGGMLTFHETCSRCWCYATQGLGRGGGAFHVTCSRCWCYATQGLGWGGGDVNVPCDLLSLLMLRHAGVGVEGGMLTLPMLIRSEGAGLRLQNRRERGKNKKTKNNNAFCFRLCCLKLCV